MLWANHYVGLPWAELGRDRTGADCWGLACVIYREELGVRLAAYDGISAEEHAEIAALVRHEAASPHWRLVEGPARAFDLAVFRRGGLASHIGIVLRDGLMIHMARMDCAKVEDYSQGPFRHRFVAHYRYA